MKKILLSLMTLLIISCGGLKKTEQVDENGYREVYYLDKENVKQGTSLRINPQGIVTDSCNFRKGKIHGVRKIWTENGVLDIAETYQDGVLHGPYTTYYPDGKIKKIHEFVQNQIEGESRQYYPDGQLKAVVQFTGNLENGPFKEYFENGQLSFEGFYEGGDFEQDTLKEYDPNGKLVRKMFCEKGVCQTVWTPEKGYIERKKIFEQNVLQPE